MKRYYLAKNNIAKAIMAEIVKKYPQYDGKMEILDTWTPYTYASRNNDTNGSYMRFITTAVSRKANMSAEVRGVENVFLAGHWLRYPGGLPMAALTGKAAVEIIEEKNKPVLPFINEIAGKITDVKDNVAEKITDVKDNVAEKITDVKDNVKEKIIDVKEKIGN